MNTLYQFLSLAVIIIGIVILCSMYNWIRKKRASYRRNERESADNRGIVDVNKVKAPISSKVQQPGETTEEWHKRAHRMIETRKRRIMFGIAFGGVCVVGIIAALMFNWLSCHVVETPHSRLEGPIKQEWVARYHCTGGSGYAEAVAVDQQGNIYVAGSVHDGNCSSRYVSDDYATIKYNGAGEEIWVAYCTGSHAYDIAVDAQNSVYVTGVKCCTDGKYDLTTVKYDAAGNELWIAYSNLSVSPYLYGLDAAIALDEQGNAYVTIPIDGKLVKYNGTDGSELWATKYESAGGASEYPSIAVDDLGNVYIGGAISITKYAYDGRALWSISPKDKIGKQEGRGDVLALDTQGNVCVATGDYRVSKYDTNGNQIWTALYNSSADYGWPHAIAVDRFGDIYAVSESSTVKYTSDGTLLWAGDGGEYIAVDDMGNAYVAGGDGKWCITIKYNTDGAKVWTACYWGGLGDGDKPYGITLDDSGNVYVTGKSTYKKCPNPWGLDVTEFRYSEYITIKYSQQ